MCMTRLRPIGAAVLAVVASTAASAQFEIGQSTMVVNEPKEAHPGFAGAPIPGQSCQIDFEPAEPNDLCVGPFGGQTITLAPELDCLLINGKLDNCGTPGPQPDTWLCVFDKNGQLIVSDDNGSDFGNGKASGLLIGDGNFDGVSDVLVSNGDGTYSLRLGITGFPDGFDGNCNGFFQNAPHGQMGEFTVYIEFISGIGMSSVVSETTESDANSAGVVGETNVATSALPGVVIGTASYTDEFVSGAEAFFLNFVAPPGAEFVNINIDNTVGEIEDCDDVDFMCVTGLDPLESYCITVVGGLDYDCNPTDTQLCWIDKNCDVIATDDDSGPALGYSQLCVISDVNGTVCFAVSGGGDSDCDGWILDQPHGVCGMYVVQVRRTIDMTPLPIDPGGCSPDDASVAEQASEGDLNSDGVVDGDDLSRLLSNWGVITAL